MEIVVPDVTVILHFLFAGMAVKNSPQVFIVFEFGMSVVATEQHSAIVHVAAAHVCVGLCTGNGLTQ